MDLMRYRSYMQYGIAIVLLLLALDLAGCGGTERTASETPAGGESSTPIISLSKGDQSPLDTPTSPSASNDMDAASLSQKSGESSEHVHASRIATLRLVRAEDGRALIVRVDDVRDLYAVDLAIRFDPTRWQAADADAQKGGVQIRPGEAPRPDFVAVNNVDNAHGTIRYIATQLGDGDAFNGSGTVATVLWQTAIAPDADVSVEAVTLVNRNAQAIEVVVRE